MEFERREEDARPTRIAFLSPVSLEGLADCFQRCRAPASVPVVREREAQGSLDGACPPHQLELGLIAYRTDEEKLAQGDLGERRPGERDIDGWARCLRLGRELRRDRLHRHDRRRAAADRAGAGNGSPRRREASERAATIELVALHIQDGMKRLTVMARRSLTDPYPPLDALARTLLRPRAHLAGARRFYSGRGCLFADSKRGLFEMAGEIVPASDRVSAVRNFLDQNARRPSSASAAHCARSRRNRSRSLHSHHCSGLSRRPARRCTSRSRRRARDHAVRR